MHELTCYFCLEILLSAIQTVSNAECTGCQEENSESLGVVGCMPTLQQNLLGTLSKMHGLVRHGVFMQQHNHWLVFL